MQCIDDSIDANKYKVIIGNKEIKIETSKINIALIQLSSFKKVFFIILKDEVHQIYNGNEYEKDMEKVNDLEMAHEFVKSCYALIGIRGKFFNAFPMSISLNQINKDNMGSMPYWFVLKFNTEYALLDKQVCMKISQKSKS